MASPDIRRWIVSGRALSQTTGSAAAHGLAVLGPHRRPAAGGQHEPRPLAQVGGHLGLEVAEGRLAVLGEDPRDRLARATLDFHVGVDPIPPEPLGEQPGQGRLSGRAIADEVRVMG